MFLTHQIQDSKGGSMLTTTSHWHSFGDLIWLKRLTQILVKAIGTDPNGPTNNRLMKLYLDEANDVWASQVEAFDHVIISTGRWFYQPQVFFENDKVVGCHIKNLTMLYGYRTVFRTAFKTLMGLENFNGVTILRTLSPARTF